MSHPQSSHLALKHTNPTYYSSIHHHANLTYTQAIGTMEPPLNSTTSSPSRKELGKYDSATVAAALAQNYLEEAQALLQALDILSQLAAMNTSDYHGTLMGRPSPDFTRGGTLQLSTSLMSVQKKWKLEQTPIPSLAGSIQRLHSNLATLQSLSEQQSEEILALQERIQGLEKDNALLENAVSGLQKRDRQQAAKRRKHREEKKALLKHVEHYAQRAKELQKINAVYKVQAHEHLLSHCNRCRLDSMDCGGSLTTTTEKEDDSSVPSDSSMSSKLVTDEGVATVKLAPPRPQPRTSQTPVTQTLIFLRGSKMGIKIRSVPLEDPAPLSPQQQQAKAVSPSSRKRTRGLLSLDQLDGTESQSNKDREERESSGMHDDLSTFASQLFSFSPLGTNITNGTDQAKATATAAQPDGKSTKINPRNCFVVVGFTDSFKEGQNQKKPPVGSRIVAVNGQSVPESLTMKAFMPVLAQASRLNGNGDKTTFTVTFRNDPLTRKQIFYLNQPSSPQTLSPAISNNVRSKKATPPPTITILPSSTTEDATNDEAIKGASIRKLSVSSSSACTIIASNIKGKVTNAKAA